MHLVKSMAKTRTTTRIAAVPTLEKPMNSTQLDSAKNGNGSVSIEDASQETEILDENSGKKSTYFSYNRAIKSGYRQSPQPLDFIDGMLSDEFCTVKLAKTIIEPQEFASKEEWMIAAEAGWEWLEQKDERLASEEAQQMWSSLVQDQLLYKHLEAMFENAKG